MSKKILIALLSVFMCCSLLSCGGDNKEEKGKKAKKEQTSDSETDQKDGKKNFWVTLQSKPHNPLEAEKPIKLLLSYGRSTTTARWLLPLTKAKKLTANGHLLPPKTKCI